MATPEKNATKTTPVVTPEIIKTIMGKIGTPFIMNEFEITVKNVVPSDLRISVWIEVKNTVDVEKQFKLNPNPVLIDNKGNQYETIIVARSDTIQNKLYPKTMDDGALFFERLKEGRSPNKLILEMNGQKAEVLLEK
jgi:hypothetical protein